MLSRCITSSFSNHLNKTSSELWGMKWREFRSSNMSFWWKKKDDGPKITKPGNCAELPKPFLEPYCKNAIVIGGTDGCGYSAADHLLCRGANAVVIADHDPEEGLRITKKLRDDHGKNRVHFIEYDIRNSCQVDNGLKAAVCKVKRIHIIFNDIDTKRPPMKCGVPKDDESETARIIRAGTKILRKDQGGTGGIIINCASIYGFMGWPEEPTPVYCKKEPAIEDTQAAMETYKEEETGVRLVVLCPTTRHFSDIGLPMLPEIIPNKKTKHLPPCIPDTKYHIGTSLSYVMAWAKTGSAWVVEPAFSVHRVPRLIHFPENEGDKVDPKIYEEQNCSVKLNPPCVNTSKASVPPKKRK